MKVSVIKRSIAFKIALFVACFMVILQLVSGTFTYQAENWLIDNILNTLWNDAEKNFEKQKTTQLKELHQRMNSNADVIGQSAAYNLANYEDVYQVLISYMAFNEIQAIASFDDSKNAFNAIWRGDKILEGQQLPGNFSLDGLDRTEAGTPAKEVTSGTILVDVGSEDYNEEKAKKIIGVRIFLKKSKEGEPPAQENWKIENFNSQDKMKEILKSTPAIRAIVAYNDYQKIFHAVWRTSLLEGAELPANIVKGEWLAVEAESIFNNNVVGRVKIYYSDQLLRNQFSDIEKSTFQGFDTIKGSIQKSRATMTTYQILGLAIIVSLFLTAIFFIIRRIVKPLRDLAGLMSEVKDLGDFSLRSAADSRDEVGEIANALNMLLENLQFSIDDVNELMRGVTEGDLSKQISSKQKGDLDKLNTSINDSIQLLNNTIIQVISSAQEVAAASQELSKSSQTLADGTSNQAANLEEVSSTLDEILGQAKENNKNALQARQLIDQTQEVVQRSNQQMTDMMTSINKIDKTSADIFKIIKVIDEIAFQTNLLALNAAVEAARAGVYGKGFAVVAEEVRNLAARSAEAAKNTAELIESSVKEVENGVQNADKTAKTLNDIGEAVTQVDGIISAILTSSDGQSSGIEEINKGLGQVNTIVQQNASISEETAASSQELTSQALHLNKTIGFFKMGGMEEMDESTEIKDVVIS